MKAFRIFAAALVAAFAISCGSATDNVKVDVELPSQAEVDSVSTSVHSSRATTSQRTSRTST